MRRLVFYLSGFDPRGVRYYYGLLREQAARYAEIERTDVIVTARQHGDKALSACTLRDEARDVTTELTFLRWEDIVSRAWIRDPLSLFARAARTYWRYLRWSDWKWVRTLPRGPLITLFYPPLLSLLTPLTVALLVLPVALHWLAGWAALPLALLAGFAVSIPLLARIKAYWLLRFFVFNSEEAGGSENPAIAERLRLFAEVIAHALTGKEADEVLLVAHSNGSILAMPLMDRLIGEIGPDLPKRFALVTLGHCIPLISGRRDATAYREVLRRVAQARFRWIDIGSPTDGAAFAGVDPLRRFAAKPRTKPVLLSPRWFRFFDRTPGKIAWSKKYDNHFNYLRTADRTSPIDYPSLLLSPRPIEEAVAAFRSIP